MRGLAVRRCCGAERRQDLTSPLPCPAPSLQKEQEILPLFLSIAKELGKVANSDEFEQMWKTETGLVVRQAGQAGRPLLCRPRSSRSPAFVTDSTLPATAPFPAGFQEGDSGDKPNEYIEACICRKEQFLKVREGVRRATALTAPHVFLPHLPTVP